MCRLRHDSKETELVLTEPPREARGEPAWLDAGYAGMEDVVKAKHMTPIICEKGKIGHPLTDEQKERNRQKSKVRSRVEHVFGFVEQTMGRLNFRGVGMIRAKATIALTKLVYNMCQLRRSRNINPI
ncbi:MAG: transposase [Bacteroidales bacterium]|nr:transposase [Bacteroidales bacterium]